MLQRPPNQQLSRRALVLARQLLDHRVLHLQSADQRCVRLNEDVVLGARVADVDARVEGMHFDLVDGGRDAWVRVHELADVLDAVVGHAAAADLAGGYGVFDCSVRGVGM